MGNDKIFVTVQEWRRLYGHNANEHEILVATAEVARPIQLRRDGPLGYQVDADTLERLRKHPPAAQESNHVLSAHST